jgi:hypothetical protein
MTKETLKRAVLLNDEIKKAKEDVEALNRIPSVSPKYLLIDGASISLCKELTEKVIRLLVDYKQERITELQKELDEL